MHLVKTMTQRMFLALMITCVISVIYFILPVFDISAENESKTFLSHSGSLIKTTGDILDPIGYSGMPLEFNPDKYLREFSYGRISHLSDGTIVREFTIIAEDDKIMEISPGVFYNVWTFNGTVPGPTIRATEGDLVRIHFINNGKKQHTMHFHGIHEAEMDGVLEPVGQGGGRFTYEFVAGPVGVHPYHCHVMPLEEHISHGLYGVYIVDPKEGRSHADEMVIVLNGFDTDFDTENNFYAANTIPFYYQHHPIQINTNELIRIYVINILEFDQINNLHLHGNLFDYYPTGTYRVPSTYTDVITFSQGERGIIEFNYTYPGKYLFHAHKTEFAEKGWTGLFLVKNSTGNNIPYGDT